MRPNPQETSDLVTFTEEILNGKLHFLYSGYIYNYGGFKRQPPEVFYNKSILKNFAKFTGKHMRRSLFFNKVIGLRL